MNALVYGITVMGWSDVAVVTSPGMLGALHCTAENGNKIHGYFCLFRPMPHVCTFHSQKVRMGKKREMMDEDEACLLSAQYCNFFFLFPWHGMADPTNHVISYIISYVKTEN